jgi:hypothetical protein
LAPILPPYGSIAPRSSDFIKGRARFGKKVIERTGGNGKIMNINPILFPEIPVSFRSPRGYKPLGVTF